MFVHLRCHSHYSFLRGVNPPEEIIAAAVAQKMPAVALTDSHGLYAAVSFCQAARKAGVKPIVGVVLKVAAGGRELLRPRSVKGARAYAQDDNVPTMGMVFLAIDMAGYSNLCVLTTLHHLGTLRLGQNKEVTSAESEGRPVTLEELAEHHAGIIALCPAAELLQVTGAGQIARSRDSGGQTRTVNTEGCSSQFTKNPTSGSGSHDDPSFQAEFAERALPLPVQDANALRAVQEASGNNPLSALKEIFGDRLYLEVQYLSPGDGRLFREAQRLGRELNIPLVATNNVHFLKPEEHLHHRAVNAIRTGSLLTTVAPPEITTPEAWFKPAAEMQKLFPDHPALLLNTLNIADRCNLELELGKLIFPEFPVPQGESPFSYLWQLCFAGAQKRYHPLRPEVLSRLTHELEVINKLNLAPYFLLVWDIVEEANRRGIPAVARGSAASSMVTYCLGISCVCPLRWGLYFERFLNLQRGDCPDIDIDICGARRDELLDYVYKRWGSEHVAMIGSFITMHARLAVREVAKVFGVPPGEVNHFTKRLPRRPVRELLEAMKNLPECRNLPVNDEPWKTILQVALRLDDAPRHLGIHPCGTVISAKPLTLLTPLERATKGIVVTQYDMNTIEALGLIKMDLLGQRGLTTMALALDNIEKSAEKTADKSKAHDHNLADREYIDAARQQESRNAETVAPDGVTPRPKARTIDFAAIPENDPATCEVMAAGRTMGLFQIESPGMRGLLRTMKARTLEEVAAALALIRPGAAEYGSKELFLKRLRGKEPLTFAHESLKAILGDTLGVCIYQEQVMQIAQAVGNMSLLEADIVRRSAAKFSGQRERDRLRGKFLKAAEQMGLEGPAREETWMMVEKFAGFGFCKAHAATYADISYRMTYLKTHHTADFLAAMCSAGAGFYHVSAYVEEAKRWGIAVRLPSVNHSRMEYTTEAQEDGKRALRVGLLQVKGLRVETMSAIAHEREASGGFDSLEDFLRRVPAERDEIESLIKCGAFDDVCGGMTRPAMLWQWNLLQARGRRKNSQVRGSPKEKQILHPQKARVGDDRLDRDAGVRGDIDNVVGMSAGAATAAALFVEMEPQDSLAAALRAMHTNDYTPEQALRYEREILEVCVSGHPLDFFPRCGEVWSDELPKLHGKRVTLCGWVVTYRHVGTKNYRNMMFVTLEDQHGLYEVILFPDAYDKYGGLVYETRAMRVTGLVQDGEHINGESLDKLRGGKRDFR